MARNAAQYADSLIEGISRSTDEGAPFGHTDEYDHWHDVSECPEDCEGMEASAMDYLSDALDIHYVIGSDREYRGARVCIALGGPTAWLNTYTGELEVSWWSAPETRELPKDFIDGLDGALSDLWEMR